MAPLLVFVAATLLARIFTRWRDAVRIGFAVMFLFTGAAHFAPTLKHELAAMIPPPFTGSLPLIYVTGVLEIAGGLGLLLPRRRRLSAICLVLLLIGMFPANVYAATHGVPLRGAPAMDLWLRTPLQIVWIALLWWSAIRRERPSAPDRN